MSTLVNALTWPVIPNPRQHLVSVPDSHPTEPDHVHRGREAGAAHNLRRPGTRHSAEHLGDVGQGGESHAANVGRPGVAGTSLAYLTGSKWQVSLVGSPHGSERSPMVDAHDPLPAACPVPGGAPRLVDGDRVPHPPRPIQPPPNRRQYVYGWACAGIVLVLLVVGIVW